MSFARGTSFSRSFAVLATLVATALVAAVPRAHAVALNVTHWQEGMYGVPFAVALEKGYFKEAGLDVTLVRGYGGNRTANELDQGQFEIGYVDAVSLMLNRSNGGKIRLVGAINTSWPGGICYVDKAGTPKKLDDLKGLTMGGGSASPVQNIVPAWLEQNGKPKDFIKLLRLDPAVVDASLIEGKIDLAECWRGSNRAILQKQAAAAGVKLGWIEYGDLGLNAYGSGFAATEDMIAKRPDVIRKFMKAAYRGYEFAIANPEQAADIMVKMYPTVDRAAGLQQIKEIGVLIVDPQAKDRGIGYLRDDRARATVQFVDKAFALNGKVKVEDIYTNDLVK
jgi:NitT/TauT family transport system substrate-binding protein